MSETVDVRTLQKLVGRLRAITDKAHLDEETGRYWVEADAWRELLGLLASSAQQAGAGVEKPRHTFAPSGKCSGCGMTESYYEGAMAILRGWPEDSEKEERMVELRTCKNDPKGGQRPK